MSRKKSKKIIDLGKGSLAVGSAKDPQISIISSSSAINSTINPLVNQEKSKESRTKFFATIVYPDSAPNSWVDIIRDTHVPALISPLHDKDVDPSGKLKKPHYHVMLVFDSQKNFERQVKPIFDSFGGVGREEILSQRGYARYMCHKDNPEKYQYDEFEVKELNGACYSATSALPNDGMAAIEEMIEFIEDNDIYSFRKLFLWCKDNRKDWFRLLANSKTYIIKEYLKSRYWDLENEDKTEYLRSKSSK